jgi:hypothetical protein
MDGRPRGAAIPYRSGHSIERYCSSAEIGTSPRPVILRRLLLRRIFLEHLIHRVIHPLFIAALRVRDNFI